MKDKIKVALVGAGGWGYQHARIFSRRKDVEFCAIAGRSAERTQARAAEFGVRAYLNIAEMLEQERPDLVSLCLPNQGHFEPTMEVIEAGFPLLVEKPLAFELEHANRLIEAAAARKLFFAINFNHRYGKPVQMARAAIREGKVGEIVFASWRFGGEGGSDHPHGNLIETQCHGFDMLEHLCGPIASISSEMTDKTGKGYSTLVLALRFVNGAVGTLIGTYDSSYAYPGTHSLEINGTLGRVTVQDTVRRFSFQRVSCETEEVWQAGYFNDRERDFHGTFDRHFDEILAALKVGKSPPVPVEAGRRALVLAHAAIRAFETGRRVEVPPVAQLA
jgi:predicted dehydrogenase